MRWRSVAAAASVVVASLVVTPSLASPSQASVRPCTPGYSYAGYAGRDGVSGVAATIEAIALPTVWTGHAAAWVRVRAALSAISHGTEMLVYRGQVPPELALDLPTLRGSFAFPIKYGYASVGRVVETGRDVWNAFVDGRRVGEAAYLPTAEGSWRPVATAESWAAGRSTCNRYEYRFDGVTALQSRRWRALTEPERLGAGVTGDRFGFSARS